TNTRNVFVRVGFFYAGNRGRPPAPQTNPTATHDARRIAMFPTTSVGDRRSRPLPGPAAERLVDSHAPPACRREEAATTPEEVLVADPRGDLTPVEMVDQKLRALLGSSARSLHCGHRPKDFRRMRGK